MNCLLNALAMSFGNKWVSLHHQTMDYFIVETTAYSPGLSYIYYRFIVRFPIGYYNYIRLI